MPTALWGVHANDVAYTFPVLLWLSSFGVSRFLYPSILRALSMRFDLCPSYPVFNRADMDLPENVAATAEAMAATAGASTAEDHWLSALGAQRRRYVAALLLHAVRVGAYWCRVLTEVDGGLPPRWGGRALSALLSCVTALCVHANRVSLTSSVLTYLYTLSIGKACVFRNEAVVDLAGAVVAAALTNALLLTTTRNLDLSGAQVLSRGAVVSSYPVLRWVRFLLPIVQAGVLFMSSGSISVSLHHRFNDFTAGSTAPPPPTPPTPSTSLPRAVGPSPGDAAFLATAGSGEPHAFTPSDWARTAGAVEVVAPTRLPASASALSAAEAPPPPSYATPIPRQPIAYVCGGESFAYAFSGFRFTYRGDTAQLRGAAWCFWMDSLQSYMNLQLRRGASDGAADSASPFTTMDHTTGDVFFTASSSEELSRQNILAFAVGSGVGLALQQAPLAVRLARRTPGLAQVINHFSPPPPPPIDIPESLMDATLTGLSVVRLCVGPPGAGVEGVRARDGRPRPDPGREQGGMGVEVWEADGSTYVDIAVPPQCFCPITHCLMRDPVRTTDGFTYDREAIVAWLRRRTTSPMTNLPLSDANLVPDREVYALVQDVVERYNAMVAPHP